MKKSLLDKLIEEVLSEKVNIDMKSQVAKDIANDSAIDFNDLVDLSKVVTSPADTLDDKDIVRGKSYTSRQRKYQKLKTTADKFQDYIDKVDPVVTSPIARTGVKTPSGKTLDDPQRSAADIDVSKRAGLKPFGDIDMGSTELAAGAHVFKPWTDITSGVTADPANIALFDSIEGDTLLKRFDSIANFAQHMQGEAGKGPSDWLTAHQPNAHFKFVNYASLLSTLGDMSKDFGGSPAGDEFEKFLALFLHAPVAGGEGGAADNVGEIINRVTGDAQRVYYSAKLYRGGDLTGVSQALGTTAMKDFGIARVITKGGRGNTREAPKGPIYYIVGAKQAGGDTELKTGETLSQQYSQIDIYIIKIDYDLSAWKSHPKTASLAKKTKYVSINKDGEKKEETASEYLGAKGYMSTIIGPDGKVKDGPFPIIEKGAKFVKAHRARTIEKTTTGHIYVFGGESRPDKASFTVPVLLLKDTTDLTDKTADFLSDVVDTEVKGLSATISLIFKRLQNLKLNTREYTGVKGGAKGMAPKEYIKAVQTDYTEIKNNYNEMFQSDVAPSTDAINEILDNLIESIVKQKSLK